MRHLTTDEIIRDLVMILVEAKLDPTGADVHAPRFSRLARELSKRTNVITAHPTLCQCATCFEHFEFADEVGSVLDAGDPF